MALPDEEIPFRVQTAEGHAEELLFSLVGFSESLTDLNPGGIARSLIEAFAIGLERLDTKMFFGLHRGIPAELYTGFGFPKLAAVKATGTVTFSRVAGTITTIVISAGTQVQTTATNERPAVLFSTTEEKTLQVGGESIDVPVAADVAGIESNVGAGQIDTIISPPADLGAVTNFSAIKNGRGPETEAEREVRFRKFARNLARSTQEGIEAGAMKAQILDVDNVVQERVDSAVALEPTDTLGRVEVYIDNGGGTASAQLVAEAQKIIDGHKDSGGNWVAGYKAAGTVVAVAAVQSVPVAVAVTLSIEDGFNLTDVKADVQEAIENFFLDLGPGDPLYIADLLCVIVSTPGVLDAAMSAPSANQNVDQSQRLLAGTITLTEAT